MTVFVDTSVWYAAGDRSDASNGRAKQLLREHDERLVTDHVLVETWSLLRHRLGRDAADRFWEAVRTGLAELEPVDRADLETAWAIGRSFPDQDFSLVDRTSFAIMQRLGVLGALSFDDDFAVYRFGPRRQRAFTVLR